MLYVGSCISHAMTQFIWSTQAKMSGFKLVCEELYRLREIYLKNFRWYSLKCVAIFDLLKKKKGQKTYSTSHH
jgi:hypothetical protein